MIMIMDMTMMLKMMMVTRMLAILMTRKMKDKINVQRVDAHEVQELFSKLI